jgi:hypothetical protein
MRLPSISRCISDVRLARDDMSIIAFCRIPNTLREVRFESGLKSVVFAPKYRVVSEVSPSTGVRLVIAPPNDSQVRPVSASIPLRFQTSEQLRVVIAAMSAGSRLPPLAASTHASRLPSAKSVGVWCVLWLAALMDVVVRLSRGVRSLM